MIKKITVIVTLFIAINSFSQKNNISPYSFFGIGQINESKTVSEQNMQIGTALNSSYKLYFNNPASLASLRLTTYSLGALNTYTKVNDGTNEQESSNFALSYLALGFPIGKKAGMVFGLQPYTQVGYAIKNVYKNTDDETESSLFRGKGRTNRVFLGFGHKLPYNISVGLEASYLFGNIERTIYWRNENRSDQLASLNKKDTNINGFALKFGIQNTYKLKNKLEIKSGLSLKLENEVTYEGTDALISTLNSPNPDLIFPKDEIYNRDYKGNVTFPLKTALSIGLGEVNKWFAGFEYDFQNKTNFSANFAQDNNFISYTKASNIALGGFYTPKAESITKYWERITYQAGFHIKQTGLMVNNTAVNDFGISFGVSLPSKRQLSNYNIGFEFGKKGEPNNGLVQENYFNFRLGLSLNDKWFIKRKLD